MEYPPTFFGFLKAVFDTIRGKKLRPRIPKDKSRDIDDYEGYDPSKNPGMEFWHTEAQKLAERRGQEKVEAERQMIRDYELEHSEETSTEISEAGSESEEVITDGIDGSNAELEMDEDGTAEGDFGSDADFDTDMEGSFDSGFDSDGCPDYIG